MLNFRASGICVIAALSISAHASSPLPLQDIASRIEANRCVKGSLRYEVMMPQSADPVPYVISFEQQTADNDTLSPCDYLIDWTLQVNDRTSRGFTAYFDGEHYRYRDLKLQEYHAEADPLPFSKDIAVQRRAQFVDMLPISIAYKLREIAADSSYRYEVRDRGETVSVSGLRRIRGYDAQEFEYIFDTRTWLPVSFDFDFNPASISEQIVTGTFENLTASGCSPLNEERLISLYPDIFDRYRTSSFKVENMIGNSLPAFSLPRLNGGRHEYAKGESLRIPTVIALIDPAVANTEGIISAVRSALSSIPFEAAALYVFASGNLSDASDAAGTPLPSEKVLLSGSSLARDLGVSAYPTFFFCDADGIVRDILIGVNNTLADDVLQKTVLCR